MERPLAPKIKYLINLKFEIIMSADKLYKSALAEAKKDKPNVQIVLKKLNLAIERGSLEAAYALGTWYLHGTYVEKDLMKATDLLEKSAKGNIPEACFDLAVCYEKGEGVEKDLSKAFDLYLKGALHGDEQSFYEVGRCYYYAIGIEKNIRVGNIWLDKAKSVGIDEKN